MEWFEYLTPEELKMITELNKKDDRSKAISEGVRSYWDNISTEEYSRRCEINYERWTQEERNKASDRSEEQWAGYSPERRKEELSKVLLNEEYRKAFAEARGNMTPEETKIWVDRSFHSPEARELAIERMAIGIKKWWADLSEEQKEKELKKRIHSIEARLASDEGLRRRWRNLSEEAREACLRNSFWKPEVLSGRGNTQTYPEWVVENWLEEHRPGEWKYNGASKEVIIGGRAPDFININGKKEVIEVFGVYWHPKEDVEQRKAHYKKYGFDCKVIWDYECLPDEIKRILTTSCSTGVEGH